MSARETPKLLEPAPGIYVRQAVDNISWVDLGDYAIVVDALEDPGLEEEVFDALRATVGDKHVRYLLNTHSHRDHIALNPAFEKRFGTEIVAYPEHTFPVEGRWFEGADRKLLMKPMPGCHTGEDCIVWAPGDSVLFTGDLFGWGMIPYVGRVDDEAERRLTRTYRQLIPFEADTVVPGHGPLCTTAELSRWVDYLAWLRASVGRARAAGKSLEQISAELPPPDDMAHWWRFREWKHAYNLRKVFETASSTR